MTPLALPGRCLTSTKPAAISQRPSFVGEHLLFAFLTCQPNGIVEPIHPKAMPVILPDRESWDAWLTTETPIVMQQPLDDDKLKRIEPHWIVAPSS